MLKVLNLYAGIGGNRKLWKDVEVTAIENDIDIMRIYQDLFPHDILIPGDAHQYLLDHYKEFDFIWSSIPCTSHSYVRYITQHQNKPIYPNMKLYEEIVFLQHFFKGKWVVENVISYYEPLNNKFLKKPQEIGKHYFWSNFKIPLIKKKIRNHNLKIKDLQNRKGFDLSKYDKIDKRKVLRNCVEPELGLHIFESAFEQGQKRLGEVKI
jgi:DNA (cytosine-5)-methyltransferase 1